MNYYDIYYTLANGENLPSNICLLLDPCVKEFNEISKNSTLNIKKINKIESINYKILKIQLQSELKMDTPGRSMTRFSLIIKNNKIMDQYITHNHLFKSINFNKIKNFENKNSDLNDIDFINELIKFIFEKNSNLYKQDKNKEIALENMKILAIDFGIIKNK